MIQIKLREVKMMINHYLIEKYGAEQFDKFQRDHNGKQTVLDISAKVLDVFSKAIKGGVSYADRTFVSALRIPVKK